MMSSMTLSVFCHVLSLYHITHGQQYDTVLSYHVALETHDQRQSTACSGWHCIVVICPHVFVGRIGHCSTC
jgi:hypothetical protein